jgi:hypothetical protein
MMFVAATTFPTLLQYQDCSNTTYDICLRINYIFQHQTGFRTVLHALEGGGFQPCNTDFFLQLPCKKAEFTEGMKKVCLKTGKMFSLKTLVISQENRGHIQVSLAYHDGISYDT